ncbi:MAG: hypothetical protein C0506_17255, partial [Anaerolinea sp.]|nr:hypothetical protein [Anaerolinea sp.]
ICFDGIAAELNRRRLRDRNARLLDPGEAAKTPRLAKAAFGWLERLPSDMAADGTRMKRALRALHEIIGNDREFVVRVERIASLMKASDETTRRGLRDLEEACVVAVVRRERERRTGGQGPSQYMIVWPTVVDLARSQGFQRSLFPDDGEPDASTWNGRSDKSSEGLSEVAPCGEAPTHDGEAPTHRGEAPTHRGEAHTLDRAREIPFRNPDSKYPPSPPSPSSRRSQEGAEAADLVEWVPIRKRLAAYGMGNPRDFINVGAARGWTPDQVTALLDCCERLVVGAVQAHPPGRLWWQIRQGEPGSEISMPPVELYRRAAREREMALDVKRRAAKAAPAAAEEEKPGEPLDELGLEQLAELVELVPEALRR